MQPWSPLWLLSVLLLCSSCRAWVPTNGRRQPRSSRIIVDRRLPLSATDDTASDAAVGETSDAPKRRRKKNKYANFSRVQQETDPFEELLAESQQKQAILRAEEQARLERRHKRRPTVPVEPVGRLEFPDAKAIDPYDPATFGYVEIGHVTAAHGVRGWIKVTSTTDFALERLCAAGVVRHLRPRGKRAPRQVTLLRGKHRSEDEYLVQLQDVEDRDAAAKLRGATLYVRHEDRVVASGPADESISDEPQEYIVSDLVNMDVYDQQTNNLVGKVNGVVLAEDMCATPGLGQDLLEVTLQKGPVAVSWRDQLVLIPLVPQIVPAVNVTAGQLWIDPPSGLLDLTYFREERVRLKGFLPPASWEEDV